MEMAETEKLTPMMRQYRTLKREYSREILFFRLGDFYEMFEEDAKTASSILNVTLTSRNGIPMCGIPYHAAKSYVKKLLDAGKRVAVCEQTDIPEKGIATREVVQVISPGTVIDDDMLASARNNFILAAGRIGSMLAASWIDVSTGEFFIASLDLDMQASSLRKLLFELDPSEVLIQESLFYDVPAVKQAAGTSSAMVTTFPDWSFDIDASYAACTELFGTRSLQAFGIEPKDSSLFAAGVLLSYVKDAAKVSLGHISSIQQYSAATHILMDESTQKNLELVKNLQDAGEHDTLYSVLRHTRTASGARKLRSWIVRPLSGHEAISRRLDAVDRLYHTPQVLTSLRNVLKGVLDMERITTRILAGKAHPKDLVSLRQSIEASLSVYTLQREVIGLTLEDESIRTLTELSSLIDRAVFYNPEASMQYLIKPKYDHQLDALRVGVNRSSAMLEEYQEQLREETGISKLRIRSNKILGHYIEVSKSFIPQAPDTFIRKQTLVNGERYTTEALIAMESQIEDSKQQYRDLEQDIFRSVLQHVRDASECISTCADITAAIDCMQSLAHSAVTYGYVKPSFTDANVLSITKGRHPVVEKNLPPGDFVPNDLHIARDYHRFCLITGPNMAGKSTYLRQNALIVVMAHIGSFVPAEKALIGTVDKIFCRVGASDNLARGESTFLVEMHETAYILRNATQSSLIIMDEVGRGTSTADGISIAFAVLHRLLELRSKVLFATHFHELTRVDSPLLHKLYLEILEEGESITFLNRVKEGSMHASYGIHVAKLAGLPRSVIRRADAMLKQLELTRHSPGDQQELFSAAAELPSAEPQHRNTDRDILEIIDELASADINRMSPVEALIFLDRLKRRTGELT